MEKNNTRRKELDEIIKNDMDSYKEFDLYEESIKIADRITLTGFLIFILTILIGIVYLLLGLLNSFFNLWIFIAIIASGFWTYTVFEWFGLVLHNLAEINNKTK